MVGGVVFVHVDNACVCIDVHIVECMCTHCRMCAYICICAFAKAHTNTHCSPPNKNPPTSQTYSNAESAQLPPHAVNAGQTAWEQHQQAVAVQKAVLWLDDISIATHQHSLWEVLTNAVAVNASEKHGQHVTQHGQLQSTKQQGGVDHEGFVETPTAMVNLQRLLLGLCQGQPVLVKGPPGWWSTVFFVGHALLLVSYNKT